jgi:hypothetical protein
VITPDGQITFEHIARDASDNATAKQLLAAVRELG